MLCARSWPKRQRSTGAGSALASPCLSQLRWHQHPQFQRRNLGQFPRVSNSPGSPVPPPPPITHHHTNRKFPSASLGLQQVEVSCYEASPDTLHGNFPAGYSLMHGVWRAPESHTDGLAPRGPTHSSGVLSWPAWFAQAPSSCRPTGEAPLHPSAARCV